jgi:hypothetical protein
MKRNEGTHRLEQLGLRGRQRGRQIRQPAQRLLQQQRRLHGARDALRGVAAHAGAGGAQRLIRHTRHIS